MSRYGKLIFKGGSVRLGAFIVTSLVQFFMVPFVLGKLGEYDYGLWALVSVVTGYYGLFDLGIGSAVSRFVSRALGKNDLKSAAEYLGAGRSFFRKIALWVFAITIVVAAVGYAPWDDQVDATKFSTLIMILGGSIALSFPFACYGGALTAEMRHDVLSLTSVCGSLIRSTGIAIALFLGGGIIWLAIASAIVKFGECLVIRTLARRIAIIQPALIPVSDEVKKDIFKYSKQSLISRMADMFRFRIHPVTISTFMQLTDVTLFALHDRVIGVVSKGISSFLTILSPVFSRLDGAGDLNQLKNAYLFTYKISCFGVSFLLLGFFLGCSDFITVWLGKDYPLVVTLLKIRILGAFCAMIQMPSVGLFYGTSKNGLYAISNSIHSALTLILTMVGIHFWELPGLLWGMVAATVLVKTILQPRMVANHFGMSLLKYHATATLPNFLRLVPCYVAIWWLGEMILEAKWLSLIAFGGLSSVLFIPYVFWVGFGSAERAKFKEAMFQK